MTGTRPLIDRLAGDDEIAACFTDEADLAAMLRVEVALAAAQAEAGVIAREAAARIAAACTIFEADWPALAAGMMQDGVVVPALVKQLRAAVGPSDASAVHAGATSQDIVDTSLVLRLRDVIAILEARLRALVDALAALAARDGARGLMAHTRMQVALPITAADKIAAWRAPLIRCLTRLAEIKPRLLVLQLGGPVGTRAELGDHAEAIAVGMAARLDLDPAPAWHSQRDGIVEFGGWLSLVSGVIGKIGQDVALLAQNEVAAVKLRGGGTSSAMAHKQNPVGAEVLVALARFNAGLVGTLHGSLVHENERSGAAWTVEWLVLPRMAVTAGASLRTVLTLIDALSFS